MFYTERLGESLSLRVNVSNEIINQLSSFNWTLSAIKAAKLDNNTLKNKESIDTVLKPQRGYSLVSIPSSLVFSNFSYVFNLSYSNPFYSNPIISQYQLTLPCPRGFILNQTNPLIHQWNYETKLVLASAS